MVFALGPTPEQAVTVTNVYSSITDTGQYWNHSIRQQQSSC